MDPDMWALALWTFWRAWIAPPGRQRRASLVAGVVFGLGLATKLNALLGEVTTEHPDKAAFGASGIPAQGTVPVAVPQLADTTGAGAPGTPGNAITKSTADALSEAVAKALGPLAEAVNALGGRVESIEKSRTPSTAQPEGETEGEPVKKSAPLWSGVL